MRFCPFKFFRSFRSTPLPSFVTLCSLLCFLLSKVVTRSHHAPIQIPTVDPWLLAHRRPLLSLRPLALPAQQLQPQPQLQLQRPRLLHLGIKLHRPNRNPLVRERGVILQRYVLFSPPFLPLPSLRTHQKSNQNHTHNEKKKTQSSQPASRPAATQRNPSPTANPSTNPATCPSTATTTPSAAPSAKAPSSASLTTKRPRRKRGAPPPRPRWGKPPLLLLLRRPSRLRVRRRVRSLLQ